jgi:ferric-dicitrate binding protein FerR (iron transport regulator)
MPSLDSIDPTVIISVLTGRASEDELRELAAWRARSRANDEEYRTLARLWLAAGDVQVAPAAAPPVPNVAMITERAERGRVEGRAVTARRTHTPRLRRRFPVWLGASLAATLVAGIGVGRWFATAPPEPFGLEALMTGANEVVTVTLEDETVVRLAPESTLRFLRFGGSREVALVGRAFFTVSKDPERPFRVRLPSGVIEVLGTRFDVQGRDQNLQVAVVEGQVRVQAHGARLDLEANEVALVPREGVPDVRRVDDPYQIIDWLGRFLAFDSTPVAEVADEFERRFGVRVEVAEELRSRTLTGWFADQAPDEMLAGVCTVLEAQCLFDGDVVRMQAALESPVDGGARR